jgi:hypothetical protein
LPVVSFDEPSLALSVQERSIPRLA